MAHVDDQRVAHVLDALEAQHPGAQLLVNDPACCSHAIANL